MSTDFHNTHSTVHTTYKVQRTELHLVLCFDIITRATTQISELLVLTMMTMRTMTGTDTAWHNETQQGAQKISTSRPHNCNNGTLVN